MASARNFGLLTIVKQATAGTAMTTAASGYSMPIISGMVGPTKEWGDLPRMGNTMARLGQFAQRAAVGGTVTVLATPESLGLLLYAAMGSELTLGTAAGGVTPHTFVMADTWPATGFTVWASLASGSDADVWRFRDAQVARLQISGSSGENYAVEVEFVAKHYTKTATGASGWPTAYNTSTGTRATDVLQGAEPRFKFITSNTLLDSDSATPTVASATESFTWEVDRAPAIRYGPSLTPAVIAPDRMVNFSVQQNYESSEHGWEFLEDAYLAAINGNPDQARPKGSFDITAGVHPTGASSGSLRIISGGGTALGGASPVISIKQNWEYGTTRPDASGTPDIIQLSIDGICSAPSDGSTETAALLSSARTTLYST